jgi:hypothetical protein
LDKKEIGLKIQYCGQFLKDVTELEIEDGSDYETLMTKTYHTCHSQQRFDTGFVFKTIKGLYYKMQKELTEAFARDNCTTLD